MSLDLVHDIQAAYRKTVNAISRPGLICNIKDQADKVDVEIGCLNPTVVLAFMLLDTEVTFKVISKSEAGVTQFMSLTYAKATETERADFVFILKDASAEDVERALRATYPGNLVDPHKSATIIIEVDSLTTEKDMILTGPGVEKENYIKIKTAFNWEELRAEKNFEYPLGVDFIFIDSEGNLMCLPRTTRIIKQEIM